ncbi:enolase [Tanacetum coccineum]
MILPIGASSFKEAMKMDVEVFHNLRSMIKKKYRQDATNIGEEGGLAPNIQPFPLDELAQPFISKLSSDNLREAITEITTDAKEKKIRNFVETIELQIGTEPREEDFLVNWDSLRLHENESLEEMSIIFRVNLIVEGQMHGFKVNLKPENKSKLSSIVLKIPGNDQLINQSCLYGRVNPHQKNQKRKQMPAVFLYHSRKLKSPKRNEIASKKGSHSRVGSQSPSLSTLVACDNDSEDLPDSRLLSPQASDYDTGNKTSTNIP